MRIVYYCLPCYLDLALLQAKALSQHVETHMLIELSPEGRGSSMFDGSLPDLPSGIVPAEDVLQVGFPPRIQAYWKGLASFNFAVHTCPKSIHPAAWWTARHTAKFIRSLQPDVVYLEDLVPRTSWMVLPLGDIPIVVSIHDPYPHTGEVNWRIGLARRIAFRRICHFVLHSERMQQAFCNRYGIPLESTSMIPIGSYEIYREWLQEPVPEEARMVLFFGRISPYKGLEVLIEAANRVAETMSDVHFVIAGKPVPGYSVPSLPDLPNGGTFELRSARISNAELANLFARTAIVVLPYLDATQSAVVLTAYAFGKPVVATDVGGLPDYVYDGNTGLLVAPGDSVQLSEAIVRLLEDSALRESMASNIGRIAENEFCWDRIAQRVSQLCSQLLERLD